METKTCSKCGCPKPLSEFYFKRNTCKKCKIEYSREYRKSHLDQQHKYNRNWRKKHPEQHRVGIIKWQRKHPEQIRLSRVKWRKEHPEIKSQQYRKYRQTPKGKIRKVNARHNRRAKTKGQKVTLEQWMAIKEQQHFRCYWCKQKFEDKELTMDHVIPLSKGGLHDEGNIVAACRSCNLSKHAQIWSLV
jgi:5-methylcytosine-specific restriction endonuclease McrA